MGSLTLRHGEIGHSTGIFAHERIGCFRVLATNMTRCGMHSAHKIEPWSSTYLQCKPTGRPPAFSVRSK